MLDRLLFFSASLLLFALASCSTTPQPKNIQPKALLIVDGNVVIDDNATGDAASFQSEHQKFDKKSFELMGRISVDESSEFMVDEGTKPLCRIKTSRFQSNDSVHKYTYQLQITIKDGLENSPLESIINGEREGIIQFTDYPLNSWQSTENMVVDETVIVSWFYEPKKSRYEIIKEMGEGRYLKKQLRFDPYLRTVSQVQYEILSGSPDQVDQQMSVLVKLMCR
jgi:hypothetical protein